MKTTTDAMSPELFAEEQRLKELLKKYGRMAVAYSGGVDSTYLADVAHDVLGADALLILADSPSMPRSEMTEAILLANQRHWHLAIIQTDEFQHSGFLRNDGKRCYVCKSRLFEAMQEYANAHGISVVAYGENADDLQDPTRLGAIAAAEHGAVAPLREAGLKKEDIRILSRARNLPTWNKPSFACLASRFPKGSPITESEMIKIERAEEVLKKYGFAQYRARHHGDLCRIELDPADFAKILEPSICNEIVSAIRNAGYRFVTLDLFGYRPAGLS